MSVLSEVTAALSAFIAVDEAVQQADLAVEAASKVAIEMLKSLKVGDMITDEDIDIAMADLAAAISDLTSASNGLSAGVAKLMHDEPAVTGASPPVPQPKVERAHRDHPIEPKPRREKHGHLYDPDVSGKDPHE